VEARSIEQALPGWRLAWYHLELADPAAAAGARAVAATRARAWHTLPALAEVPTVTAVRRLLKGEELRRGGTAHGVLRQ
jgi:hypothetical protein